MDFDFESQSVISFSIDLSEAGLAVALDKAELLSTAKHTDISRPSLRIKLVHAAILKLIIHKGAERICAESASPSIPFANVNTDGTVKILSFLRLLEPLIIFVDTVGADPADMSAVPFIFKFPPASIIGNIFDGFIVFTPRRVFFTAQKAIFGDWLGASDRRRSKVRSRSHRVSSDSKRPPKRGQGGM